MATVEITKANFDDEVVKSEKPVLLDFWAEWCGPCRALAPVVEEIAAETEAVKVGKVNVEREMELARRFGVSSIPTLILFKSGEVAERTVGVQPKAAILGMLGL